VSARDSSVTDAPAAFSKLGFVRAGRSRQARRQALRTGLHGYEARPYGSVLVSRGRSAGQGVEKWLALGWRTSRRAGA
jgi:hypothetical protein